MHGVRPPTIGLVSPLYLQDFSWCFSVIDRRTAAVHHQHQKWWTDGSDALARRLCCRHRSWRDLWPPSLHSIKISCSCPRYFRVSFLAAIEGHEKTNGSVSGTSSALSESGQALFESGRCSLRLGWLQGCTPNAIHFGQQLPNLRGLTVLEIWSS